VSCRRRPSNRIPRTARQSLRGPRDALDVITLAASGRAETICLLLDHAHRGITVVIIEGSGPDDDLVGLGDLLVRAATETGAVGAVVLATARPGRSHLPDAGDERRWFDLRIRFEEAGVDLLDWFVLSGGLASSLCELTDSRWRWLDDGP